MSAASWKVAESFVADGMRLALKAGPEIDVTYPGLTIEVIEARRKLGNLISKGSRYLRLRWHDDEGSPKLWLFNLDDVADWHTRPKGAA